MWGGYFKYSTTVAFPLLAEFLQNARAKTIEEMNLSIFTIKLHKLTHNEKRIQFTNIELYYIQKVFESFIK